MDLNNDELYIIFFGKSQSFNFIAFDKSGMISDFNKIIVDFDLLESQIFTVDKPDNSQMLAKYSFKRTRDFTLIKAYSYAQAFDGSRIQGSIFGVSFLSTKNIILSAENIELLLQIKKSFSDACLKNNKFITSDFTQSVVGIWEKYNEINIYSRIITIEHQSNINEGIIGVYTESLKNIIDFNYKRMYFSEDINHLIRTHEFWNDRFPIYKINKNNLESLKFHYDIQQEVEKETIPLRNDIDQIKELEYYKNEMKRKDENINILKNTILRNNRKFKFIIVILSIIIALFIIYIVISRDKKSIEVDNDSYTWFFSDSNKMLNSYVISLCKNDGY